MARRPRAKEAADDVRTRILISANRLFAAKGVESTSLQDIADEVGVRKQSLLYYFPNKDDLHKNVLERLLSHWNEVLPRLFVASSTVRGRIENLLSAVIAFFAEDPDRARLLTREMLDRPDAMRRMMSQHTSVWMKMVCDSLRQGQSDGMIRPDLDPEAFVLNAIHLVLAGVAHHQVMGVLLDGKSTIDRYAAELIRLVRSGILRERHSEAARA
jgi:TetR/AcrR family transcriptional regulator